MLLLCRQLSKVVEGWHARNAQQVDVRRGGHRPGLRPEQEAAGAGPAPRQLLLKLGRVEVAEVARRGNALEAASSGSQVLCTTIRPYSMPAHMI